MGIAQSRSVAVQLSARKRPEFADLIKSLADEASRLSQPVRVIGASSLGVALLSWLLFFSSYSLDSTKSLALCMAFFAFVLTPGFVFLWLGESLRQLEQLPRRLPREKAPPPAVTVASVQTEAEATETLESSGILRRIKARLDNVLVLWEHLSFSKAEIQELVGPSRSMAFLAHPASAFMIAGAFLIGVFVALGSVVALLAKMISAIL